MLLFHVVVVVLLGGIPFGFRIDCLEFVIQLIKLGAQPVHLVVDDLEPLVNREELVLPEHYYLLVVHLLLFVAPISFLFLTLIINVFLVVLFAPRQLLGLLVGWPLSDIHGYGPLGTRLSAGLVIGWRETLHLELGRGLEGLGGLVLGGRGRGLLVVGLVELIIIGGLLGARIKRCLPHLFK